MTNDELESLKNLSFLDVKRYNDYRIIMGMVIHEKMFVVVSVFKGEISTENFVFQKIFDVSEEMTQTDSKLLTLIEKLKDMSWSDKNVDFWEQWTQMCNDSGEKDLFSEKFEEVKKEIDKLK